LVGKHDFARHEPLQADIDARRSIGAPARAAPLGARGPRRPRASQRRRQDRRVRQQEHFVLRRFPQRRREPIVGRDRRDDLAEDVPAGLGGRRRGVKRAAANLDDPTLEEV